MTIHFWLLTVDTANEFRDRLVSGPEVGAQFDEGGGLVLGGRCPFL